MFWLVGLYVNLSPVNVFAFLSSLKYKINQCKIKYKILMYAKEYANVQVCKCASMHMCNCTCMQMCKYANVKVCKSASMQICKCASMQMCKCANVQVCKCARM